MAKNISVVDAQGHFLEATYPKRAKGLVKKGRARFIDRFTICLAGPPLSREDSAVSFINKIKYDSQPAAGESDSTQAAATEPGSLESAISDSMQAAVSDLESADPAQLDSAYLIRTINQILTDSGYLHTALQQLKQLDETGARAAADMIACREQTNQRMIDFLEKLMGKLTV